MNEDVGKSVGKYRQLQGEDSTHQERDLEREVEVDRNWKDLMGPEWCRRCMPMQRT